MLFRGGFAMQLLAALPVVIAGADPGANAFLDSAIAAASAFLFDLNLWIADSYARAPALVLGLAMAIALSPLTLLGLVLRRRGRDLEQTRVIRRTKPLAATSISANPELNIAEREPAWPSRAWIELEAPAPGVQSLRHGIGHGVVRIGRDSDNDVCLMDQTVHRFHAAIHQSEDAEYFITDLSSRGGNGVVLNGRHIGDARLVHGDNIMLGSQRMRFIAEPA